MKYEAIMENSVKWTHSAHKRYSEQTHKPKFHNKFSYWQIKFIIGVCSSNIISDHSERKIDTIMHSCKTVQIFRALRHGIGKPWVLQDC